MASEAKRRANHKYNARVDVNLQCQQRKEVAAEIKDYAKANGESLAGFIRRACYAQMERDKAEPNA